MDSRAKKISSPLNKKIELRIIPGHFATSYSHVNYYIDMTTMKTRQEEALDLAKVMARQYVNSVVVDTIVCMDGCEVIGAYLAQELTNVGIHSMNSYKSINIISPEFNTNGQMIFRDNMQEAIYGKNVLLLVASATTGNTIQKSLECIQYYGGRIAGISAIFSAVDHIENIEIHSIFDADNLPNYKTFSLHNCPLCESKQKLDAIVNGYGYIKL